MTKLRLIDGPAPSGEIRALDLARITGSLHELSIRLGRERAATTRPGRSRRTTEELAEVRVVALREGSTVLDFAVGPADMLPIELEDMVWHDQELVRILSGLAKDERPDGVSDHAVDPVARSVGEDVTTVAGLLEKIDIHVHDLRIRGDVGNTLPSRADGDPARPGP